MQQFVDDTATSAVATKYFKAFLGRMHHFLGRASESEAQIESFHYEFKRLYHQQHLYMAHDEAERMRRCLADVALRAVQPFVRAAVARARRIVRVRQRRGLFLGQ